MGQQESGIDDVGWCSREWQFGYVVHLEPGGGDTGPSAGYESFGRIDADERPGPEHLTQELGGETRSTAEVDDHLRGW